MVAARNPGVAFIVMMAGSGVRGDEIIVAQSALIAEAAGAGSQTAQSAGLQLEVLALVKQEKDDAVLAAKLRDTLAGKFRRNRLACRSRR